jgi:small subunit ribosomal protein S8
MDTIANMLTIIRNGCMAKKQEVVVQYSKINEKIIEIFKREGFILGYEKDTKDNHPVIRVKLGYDEKRRPIINAIVRVSKPGRRVYVKHEAIQPVKRGLGIAILSTSKGLMTDKEAIKNNIGGELLCKIW